MVGVGYGRGAVRPGLTSVTLSGMDDLQAMSREELIAHFDSGGDISELLRDATRGPDLGPAPDPDEVPVITPGTGS